MSDLNKFSTESVHRLVRATVISNKKNATEQKFREIEHESKSKRKLLGLFLTDQRTNVWIRERTKVENVASIASLKWE